MTHLTHHIHHVSSKSTTYVKIHNPPCTILNPPSSLNVSSVYDV